MKMRPTTALECKRKKLLELWLQVVHEQAPAPPHTLVIIHLIHRAHPSTSQCAQNSPPLPPDTELLVRFCTPTCSPSGKWIPVASARASVGVRGQQKVTWYDTTEARSSVPTDARLLGLSGAQYNRREDRALGHVPTHMSSISSCTYVSVTV